MLNLKMDFNLGKNLKNLNFHFFGINFIHLLIGIAATIFCLFIVLELIQTVNSVAYQDDFIETETFSTKKFNELEDIFDQRKLTIQNHLQRIKLITK